jgi:hypothetical protein
MPIAVDIDVMLARRKMSVGELADRVGITPANLAILKNCRAEAVRFATLARSARCSSASRATCCAGRPRTPRADDVPRAAAGHERGPPRGKNIRRTWRRSGPRAGSSW